MHHSSVTWELTQLYFFSWNFIWYEQKKLIKAQNFRLSTVHVKLNRICTFIGSFCWKEMQNWRVIQNLKKSWFVVSNMTRIWWILTRALESLKYCTLIESFCAKYITFNLKSTEGYLSWHWRVIKNLKKSWLVVWKMTSGIWQIFTRALKSLWDFNGIHLSEVEHVWV